MISRAGMRARWLILIVLTLTHLPAIPVSWGADPRLTYQLVSPDDVELSGLSAIGREVLRRPDKWMIGQTQHFYVFAKSLRDLTDMIGQAEHAYRRAGQWFQLENLQTNRAYLVAVAENREWRRLIRSHGIRQDGLAMHIGRELYLKDDPEQQKRADRIAHEVIHLRLADFYGENVPLWLDEGLAGHYGWLCAVEYQGQRDVLLYRNHPALAEDDIMTLENLLKLTHYPRTEKKARAFYRQAEELVGVLAGRMLPREMHDFMNAICMNDADPLARFRDAIRALNYDEATLIQEMRARCLAPRKP